MQNQSTTTLGFRPMDNEIVRSDGEAREMLASIADAYARQSVFDDSNSRLGNNTLRAYRADLDKFSEFLGVAKWPDPPSGETLQTTAAAWAGVSHGLVTAFRNWQLQNGAAVKSVNRALTAVRRYCGLAFAAGVIDETAHALIATVQGYSGKDAKRIDERRQDAGKRTRVGNKKADHVSLSDEQAAALKAQPDTPQGRRDALLMCLLLDHGLRVGEVAGLRVADVDLKAGELVFYRPKVDKTQRHKLTADTLRAARAWVDAGECPAFDDAPLLRSSRKGGELTDAGMTTRSISERVRTLGAAVGVEGLSAHDCRHAWATRWAGKVDVFRLQEAGGWSSLAMPRRYTEWARIANEGMA